MTDGPNPNSPLESGRRYPAGTELDRACRRRVGQPETMAALLLVVALCFPAAALAQSEEVLHSFNTGGDDGAVDPGAGLIQASDGSFYGVSVGGGGGGGRCGSCGTVFKIDSTGNITSLHQFAGSPNDGNGPAASLVQAGDGNFYGTTGSGGASNLGTVFKMDSAGTVTILHSFAGAPSDGSDPEAGLIQASDGNFYGTTRFGGSAGHGTVFKMDSAGNVTILHSFAGTSGDGGGPSAPLIQAGDGHFYGTTSGFGTPSLGTVFRMDFAGNLTTLHSFTGQPDGAFPYGGLLQATDGTFFGTVFKMDSAGTVTILHNFAGAPNDGAGPAAGLIGNGDFYGTTGFGGAANDGTVFKMDSAGNVTILHSFAGYATDGSQVNAGVTRASDGNYYGTTLFGGSTNSGTIYRLTCSPAPVPAISVTKCLAANTPGFVASVTGNGGDTYVWTLVHGTINSGQGTNSIGFTSAGPGTLMSLDIVETNPLNCYGTASQNLQVDFADEPPSDLAYSYVCTLGRNRITSGCGGGNYCPASPVRRDQMAVFLLKAKHGSSYLPPACTGIFTDVPCPGTFTNWIEELFHEGITGGCGGGNYCPASPVRRDQMAVFLLKAEHGSSYTPPACTGIFADVQCPGTFAAWIEQLFHESITGGCGGGDYCPANPNTRGQMAVFLTKTFNLQ
jgi:uncharacterized repeat protein (TIGR03803 family)